MYNQTQGQLPFSHNQLQFQTGSYNVVPNIALDPHLQQFAQMLQPMSQVLIEEIQNKCRANPLRTFLFNQMANNGFQNAEFASLVKSAIEYFAYLVRRGQIQNPQQGVYKAAQEMVMFIAANNARNYPPLRQFEDPNKIQFVLNQFDGITQDMMRERQQGMYPGIQQQFSGGGAPGGFNQFGGGGNMNMGGTNFQQATSVTNQRSFGGGGGSLFTTGGGDAVPSFGNESAVMDRNYGGGVEAAAVSAAAASSHMVQEAIVGKLEESDTSTNLEEAARRWKPVEGCLYRPAYEPSHSKLVASRKGDKFFYTVRELGENEMDEERHRLTPLFGTNNSLITDRLKAPEVSKALAEAVSDAKTAASGVDATIDTYSRIRLDVMPIELGYDSVWVSGIVDKIRRQRQRGEDTPINITQWDSRIAKAVIIESEEQADLIRRFSKMDSTQLLMNIANKKDVLSPSVLAVIDERLTAAVNDAVRTNMSISGLNIDSFIDDWNDLINIISNKYGKLVAANFVAKDEEIIRNALNLLPKECGDDVTNGIYDTLDGETYPISYFVETVSFTALDFFSSELDLDFVPGTSALLSKVNTRVWYDLADQIYREFSDTCTRHLIRTCDGKTLEIKKGWLAENAYIINLVS